MKRNKFNAQASALDSFIWCDASIDSRPHLHAKTNKKKQENVFYQLNNTDWIESKRLSGVARKSGRNTKRKSTQLIPTKIMRFTHHHQ